MCMIVDQIYLLLLKICLLQGFYVKTDHPLIPEIKDMPAILNAIHYYDTPIRKKCSCNLFA